MGLLAALLRSQRRYWLPAAGVMFAAAIYAGRAYHRAPSAAVQAAERERAPEGMVYVPGGPCRLGSDDPDADPGENHARQAFIRSFYIDRTEVTNRDFRRFRPSHAFPEGEGDLPVTGVSYEGAEAYARWAGKRLPTEDEWEKAARGTDGRRYPWGDTWAPGKVAPRARRAALHPAEEGKPACPSRVQPVGSRPAGASPYGALDMAGNAWEWVAGFHNGDRSRRIIRGGAVGYGERGCRTYTRGIEGSGVT